MRGISEEVILQALNVKECNNYTRKILEALKECCEELNPWLPIEENTPMNRYLLCVNSVGRKDVLRLDGHSNTWRTQDGLAARYLPTHYQELPDDPEPGDEND